jgi:magnesium chelatase subunit I
MDESRARPVSDFLQRGRAADERLKLRLDSARDRFFAVEFGYQMADLCATVAAAFQVAGHRGDVVTALAARALAALEFADAVSAKHVLAVAPLALQHRRRELGSDVPRTWGSEDQQLLEELVAKAGAS